MYEKTDVKGYYRDTRSGAIVNRDLDGLNAYKKRKENNKRLNDLEKDVSDIKAMLSEILTKVDKSNDV